MEGHEAKRKKGPGGKLWAEAYATLRSVIWLSFHTKLMFDMLKSVLLSKNKETMNAIRALNVEGICNTSVHHMNSMYYDPRVL